MKTFRTIDKEIERLLEKERQKVWLDLMLALCQIENKLGVEIKKFNYDNGEILVKLSDKNYVRTIIGDYYVQDNNKNKI